MREQGVHPHPGLASDRRPVPRGGQGSGAQRHRADHPDPGSLLPAIHRLRRALRDRVGHLQRHSRFGQLGRRRRSQDPGHAAGVQGRPGSGRLCRQLHRRLRLARVPPSTAGRRKHGTQGGLRRRRQGQPGRRHPHGHLGGVAVGIVPVPDRAGQGQHGGPRAKHRADQPRAGLVAVVPPAQLDPRRRAAGRGRRRLAGRRMPSSRPRSSAC